MHSGTTRRSAARRRVHDDPTFQSPCSISINRKQLANSYPYNIITSDKMSHSNINHGDASSSSIAHYSHNAHSFNTHTHIANNDFVWNIGVTDEKSEILAWLSPLEPRIRHQHLRTRRADNVGEWLLETEKFQRWYNSAQREGSENATLFCCGGPAVGKTYLR